MRLHGLGAKNVILTGVSFDEKLLGCAISDGSSIRYDFNERILHSSHGTGDLFASTLTGAYVRGCSLLEALSIAADFTAQCVELTLQNPEHVFYGVEFERALPSLARRLGL